MLWADGGVAQLGERLLCKQEVIGSIPFTSTRQRLGSYVIGRVGIDSNRYQSVEGAAAWPARSLSS